MRILWIFMFLSDCLYFFANLIQTYDITSLPSLLQIHPLDGAEVQRRDRRHEHEQQQSEHAGERFYVIFLSLLHANIILLHPTNNMC